MLDLEPAARVLAGLVAGVRDEQLAAPTPCAGASVGDLLDHVGGLSEAFIAAGAKAAGAGGPGPTAEAARLGHDWRERIPRRLAVLARTWRDEAAWQGVTTAGGVEMPAEVGGAAAANEMIVHGWDIAAATGQEFTADPALVGAATEFVRAAVAEYPQGSPGLFGPPAPVGGGASPLEQLIALTGRDPGWRASGRS